MSLVPAAGGDACYVRQMKIICYSLASCHVACSPGLVLCTANECGTCDILITSSVKALSNINQCPTSSQALMSPASVQGALRDP